MLSFVYPIYNRAALFQRTLESFARQWGEPGDYEILCIDDGGDDHVQDLCRTFRDQHHLPIRYCKIDCRIESAVPAVFDWQGANNPACAINVGIRAARGDRVVLSSPEIMHIRPTNVLRLNTWPLKPMEALIGDVWDETMAKHPGVQGYLCGGPRQRYLHFLGVFYRADLLRVGGMEELFMGGWGVEDSEFCERWLAFGGSYHFTGQSVQMIHQPHSRPWWGDTPGELGVQQAVAYAEALIRRCREWHRQGLPANTHNPVGGPFLREWGNQAQIVVEDGWTEVERAVA